MEKQPHDFSQFSLRINIKSDLESIFTAWTSQENLEKWFLSSAVYSDFTGFTKSSHAIIEAGDTYTWKWHAAEDIAKGEVLSIDYLKSISFSFLGCEVTVKFFEEAGENMIELEQSNIKTDEASVVSYHIGCTRGWTFYMANLKSLLEGGIDLRNKNDEIKDVINT